MSQPKKSARKQKSVVFHKEKDQALIQAVQNDQSVAFSALMRQLLREHYQLSDSQKYS
ncbi:hypothetical protein U0021_06590 [Moraxella canis]|uniref:CopG family transcriptional regulator n=1 Tax=Moraxella canis TaxID=90239 RepID=A0ABZ0WW77_9GAMM|nr:hypothetical protein [Moraxella canis]WQE03420.1 hypothetical protein U0021_06590 [Moraxella canis]